MKRSPAREFQILHLHSSKGRGDLFTRLNFLYPPRKKKKKKKKTVSLLLGNFSGLGQRSPEPRLCLQAAEQGDNSPHPNSHPVRGVKDKQRAAGTHQLREPLRGSSTVTVGSLRNVPCPARGLQGSASRAAWDGKAKPGLSPKTCPSSFLTSLQGKERWERKALGAFAAIK